MKKYAKIENEETKQCSVGLGTNSEFYKSIGMQEIDVEEAYDGNWYLQGYAPEKPTPTIDEQNEVIRQTRQQLFEKYADPLKYDYEEQFAKYGADNETTIYVKELWLNKKEEIRQQNPYIEEESGNI